MIFDPKPSNTIPMLEPRILPKGYVNRSQRRLIEREYLTNDPELSELEYVFLAEILFPNSEYSYAQVYTETLLAYETLIEWIRRVRKPKGITLNETYFSKLYHPLEEEVCEIKDGRKTPWFYTSRINKKIRRLKFIPGDEMMIGNTIFNLPIKTS